LAGGGTVARSLVRFWPRTPSRVLWLTVQSSRPPTAARFVGGLLQALGRCYRFLSLVGGTIMRKFVYAVSILAFSISASAQQVVDTSEKNVDAQLLRNAISALSNQVKDPLSIQIRNLKMGLYANTPTLC